MSRSPSFALEPRQLGQRYRAIIHIPLTSQAAVSHYGESLIESQAEAKNITLPSRRLANSYSRDGRADDSLEAHEIKDTSLQ
jgi:hypothetical protein